MSRPALLIIDMLNTFDFEGGDTLLAAAEKIVAPINALRAAAHAAHFPVLFVNDNYGRWHDERGDLFTWLTRPEARGREVALQLAPRDDEYFVIKPEASGFLRHHVARAAAAWLRVTSLVLTGVAAEMCVLLTAADAHMREYDLWVPADAIAGTTDDRTQSALEIIGGMLSADILPTSDADLASIFADD